MNTHTPIQALLNEQPVAMEWLFKRAEVDRLFAVIDACDAPAVPAMVHSLDEDRAVCLYSGRAARDLAMQAPYLIHADQALLDWIVQTLWDQPWGIFIIADVKLDELRRHLKRFLMVEDPDGKEMYFRFYDPRVLRAFLPTCTPTELRQFRGPIHAYALGGKSIQPEDDQAVVMLALPSESYDSLGNLRKEMS